LEVTGYFILFSLLFVTPALFIFLAFRLVFPINRTVSFIQQGIALPALALCSGAIINGSLLSQLGLWFLFSSGIKNPPINSSAAIELLTLWEPYRPFLWVINSFVNVPLSENNLFGILGDMHLRSILAAVLAIFGIRLLSYLWQWLETAYYLALKGLENSSKFKIEYQRLSQHFPTVVRYMKEALFHPWAILTEFNPKREFLMVDVMTEDDCIYSGLFTAWIPSGDEGANALAMQYILKYSAHLEKIDVNTQSSKRKLAKDDRFLSRRKKEFVKNNGELIIPMNKIRTVHLWEVRRGYRVVVGVKNISEFAIAKWWIVLADVKSSHFKEIDIWVSEVLEVKFVEEIGQWMEDQNIAGDKVNIVVAK